MIEKLKKFFLKHQLIILFFIFWIVFAFFFYNGKIVLDTNFDLSTNPIGFFNSLFNGWSSTFYNGINNSVVYSYIFPFGFLWWIFSSFLPVPIAQSIVFSLILALSFLTFTIFIREELQTKSLYIYIGSLLYALNMYTLLTYGTSSFLFPYIALPLQLFFLRKMLLSKSIVFYTIGFGFSSLLMSGVNPPFVGIALIALIFYFLHIVISYRLYHNLKSIFLKLGLAFIISLGLNFYWILGDITYYRSLSSNGFAAVLSESLSMQNSASTYFNVLRGLSIWSFGGEASGIPYYNYASTYLSNPIFICSLFIPPLVLLFGWLVYKEQTKKYFILCILFIISIVLTVGAREGIFSFLYTFAYFHVPLFSMFRSSYKFGTIYYLIIALFIPLTLLEIKNKKRRNVLSFVLAAVILLNAFPFFTGRVFEKMKTINGIPAYYTSAKTFFESHPGTYQILLLPVQYFPVYSWGFTGGNPETIWGKGIVARQAGSALETSNYLVIKLYKYLFSGNYVKANSLMKQLNVRYIVQRNDFNWEYYRDISQPPSTIEKIMKPYKKVATYGMLDIYEVKGNASILSLDNLTFSKESSSKYVLSIQNVSQKQPLVFLQSFHKNWKLFLTPLQATMNCKHTINRGNIQECLSSKQLFSLSDLKYLFLPSIFDSTHQKVFTYANLWEINPSYIKTHFNNQHYKVNPDGSIDINLTLYFIPQLYLFIGLLVSVGFALSCLVFVGFLVLKRRNKKNY